MGRLERSAARIRARLRPYLGPPVRQLTGRDPRWGNLKRTQPFSQHYGSERGLPVDRRYIEAFLSRHAADIHGDVLEVLRPEYTRRFGAEGLRSHVVDIDSANSHATLIADLSEPGSLPAASHDCIVLTQTLQFLAAPPAALANLWGSLRAGGMLLVTVPCLSRIDTAAPQSDYWRWTANGLERLLRENCPGAHLEVSAGGNLITCQAALLGLAVEDLSDRDFVPDDPAFPLVACGAARKPA